ncbi:pantetheine-phosphate adenylyltransferase [Lacticaseibacillus parakribbianus]|uniref:pantetheine-phosphate adenylyltransferase n=1 Tax=Lacticaseibacillus parakribbianus TaxID=2970927 RepID=UPI0021CB78CB|nr:pantetheine-phosphate adenylyltransferase [Lacticaseibacillus parakribbianus]
MARIALFPGSFDPFTNGHLDTVQRASRLFDRVVIAAMTNTSKRPLFSAAEKLALIEAATAALPNVQVVAQPAMLTVAYAQSIGATALIRGVRNTADYNYESGIADMNANLAPDIETVLLFGDKRYRFISSSLIKEVAAFGGDVSALVPANVDAALKAKFGSEPHA